MLSMRLAAFGRSLTYAGPNCASRWNTTVTSRTNTGSTAMSAAILISSGVDGSPSERPPLT
jgi:hypothetical protein